jgi:choline monooxygenase
MITFAEEMAALARGAWQFLAFTDDLEHDNDYVRRVVFGTDVFVQNFQGALRGYHNVCSHRGFPIRRDAKGNGLLQCGFHGWVYNRDGVPTGVPRNTELFQLSRDAQRDLALAEIRVETIGRMVFVCLSPTPPALRPYLGKFADVLDAVSKHAGRIRFRDAIVSRAHWKTCFEISLDDYHLQAVHPRSFGAGTPSPPHHFYYEREGLHSCYLRRRDPDWSFAPYWEQLRHGVVDFTGYKIHQLFPNVLFSVEPTCMSCWFYSPIDHESTSVERYIVEWAHAPIADDQVDNVAALMLEVGEEDRATCESLQSTAGQPRRPDLLGKLELRIAWYREAYAELMRANRG